MASDWIAEQIIDVLKNSRVEVALSSSYGVDLSGWLRLALLKRFSFVAPPEGQSLEISVRSGILCLTVSGFHTWIHLACFQLPHLAPGRVKLPNLATEVEGTLNRNHHLLVLVAYPLDEAESPEVMLLLADLEALASGLLRKARFSLWDNSYMHVQIIGLEQAAGLNS